MRYIYKTENTTKIFDV